MCVLPKHAVNQPSIFSVQVQYADMKVFLAQLLASRRKRKKKADEEDE